MAKQSFLDQAKISSNIKVMKEFIQKEKLDGFYISSNDPYLNEYVPLEDCHRYYFTGFTGSTAEVIVPREGKVLIFLDGRYHEQGELECDSSEIEIVKIDMSVSFKDALLNQLKEKKIKKLGVEGDRTPLSLEKMFADVTKIITYDSGEVEKIVSFVGYGSTKEIKYLDKNICGVTPEEKLNVILKEDEAYFITALDSIAWLTNCRGFHMPYQSTFLSTVFAVKDKIYIFVEPETKIGKEANQQSVLSFEFVKRNQIGSKLKQIQKNHKIKKVFYTPTMINGADYRMLSSVFKKDQLQESRDGLTTYQSIKNKTELREIKQNCSKADRAVFKTIKWVKQQIKDKEVVSEMDFYNKANEFYKDEGALDQSFHTIAAVGANSSIIHFSDPSPEIKIKEGDLLLLDSGGLYENGYGTDSTRTFLAGDKADPKLKEIYTLVLKGCLQAQNGVYREGSSGISVDTLARQPILQKGYDYAHGTGHGVGINVHEGGINFTPSVNSKLRVGQIVSLEPGIYLPGIGGVRLENIVEVVESEKFEGMVKLVPIEYIGYDYDLIDMNLLTDEEKQTLEKYEEECKKRGTSFKS